MRLQELIDELIAIQGRLEEAPDGVDGDPVVYIATQPNYPLAHTVNNVYTELDDDFEDDDADLDVALGDKVVWITTGSHPTDRSPYAPGHVWS